MLKHIDFQLSTVTIAVVVAVAVALNSRQMINQSARYIAYKQKPYNRVF